MDARRQACWGAVSWCVVALMVVGSGGVALAGSSEEVGPLWRFDATGLVLAQSGEPGSPSTGTRGADSATAASSASDEPTAPSDEPVSPQSGAAGDTDEPGKKAGSDQSAEEPPKAMKPPKPAEPQAQYGVGLSLRAIFIPSWLLNLFLDASTSLNSVAFGAEFVRRKGNFDIIGSIDFGFYSPPDGNYLSKNGDPATDTDYVHFDNFNALSLAVHFIRHEEILRWLSFVWGGGVGISFLLGDIYRASSSGCTKDNTGDINQCGPKGMDPNDPMAWINDPANRGREEDDSPDDPKLYREEDVPPVVPLVHLLVGMNFRIDDSFSVRVDGGFRNAFYVGATGHYFF
jgi:hypothetical protein